MLTATPSAPDEALSTLAAQLRDEDSVISSFVRESSVSPALGLLAAAGGSGSDRGEYAVLVECVREGYLLHYEEPRIVVGVDGDLALLAGDYLYARGLERLASLGDLGAIRQLSDLISLSAQVHVREDQPAGAAELLWLAAMVAIAAGPSEEHESAKRALREQRADAVQELAKATSAAAERSGIRAELAAAAETVGLKSTDFFDFG